MQPDKLTDIAIITLLILILVGLVVIPFLLTALLVQVISIKRMLKRKFEPHAPDAAAPQQTETPSQ
ncbi:MAG: hypothetical protein HY350_04165 [Candidatus Omnitrophica bacterium]|nr:hypothetical protein [Candidatus Omnitrophota bacterium]